MLEVQAQTEYMVIVCVDVNQRLLMIHQTDKNAPDYRDEWYFPGGEIENVRDDTQWINYRRGKLKELLNEQTGIAPVYDRQIDHVRRFHLVRGQPEYNVRIWAVQFPEDFNEVLKESKMTHSGWRLHPYLLTECMSKIHTEQFQCAITVHTVMATAHWLGYKAAHFEKW